MTSLDPDELKRIIDELRGLPRETQWVEFKANNSSPTKIGEYLSALSNAAALEGASRGYLVWGVENETHDLVGTTFDPRRKKGQGNEDLVPWLTRTLSPDVHFEFHTGHVDGQTVVLLEVAAADHRPVQFQGMEYIRIGSYKKKLKDHPDQERRLWKSFDARSFESVAAVSHLRRDDVLRALDFEAYFELSDTHLPQGSERVIRALAAAELVRWEVSDQWSITNLGAILFARNLSDFSGLSRKAPRVIQYADATKVNTVREQVGQFGYASGFQGLFDYVTSLLPSNEIIEKALRRTEPLYPDLALRELMANMLVHQDFTVGGTGPTIEIFSNRIEITNPGVPLIDKNRFIDSPPISRNEKLARALRIMRICEERGSGWDKIGFEVEFHQLPAPLIDTSETHTKVVLFAPMKLSAMQKDDRIRAVYLHACLRTVTHEQATNSTIRARFGLPNSSAASASRLIREALEAGWIVPYDSRAGKRAMSYVPFWASSE